MPQTWKCILSGTEPPLRPEKIAMFLSFYGLAEQPFGVTPNPKFLYHSSNHREVLASLIYAIESDLGFSALIAEPGMGKTTLLMYLLEHYRETVRTAFIFQTQCGAMELLRYLLQEFNERVEGEHDQVVLYDRLRRILTTEARAGRRVVVVIDEAQNLSPSSLEAVRLLSDFETTERKLIHIIVAGQAQLYRTLKTPGMRQLVQRMPAVNYLRPFTLDETWAYINHRVALAGRCEELFTRSAVESVHYYTSGIPREINRFCFNALSIGLATRTAVIDAAIVYEVATDLASLNEEDQERGTSAAVSTESSHAHVDDRTPVQDTWTLDRWFRPSDPRFTELGRREAMEDETRQRNAEHGQLRSYTQPSYSEQNFAAVARQEPGVDRTQMMVDRWRANASNSTPESQHTRPSSGVAASDCVIGTQRDRPPNAFQSTSIEFERQHKRATRTGNTRKESARVPHRPIPVTLIALLTILVAGLAIYVSRLLPIDTWVNAQTKAAQPEPQNESTDEVQLPDDVAGSKDKKPRSFRNKLKQQDGIPQRRNSAIPDKQRSANNTGAVTLGVADTFEHAREMRLPLLSRASVIQEDSQGTPSGGEIREPELLSVVEPAYPVASRSENRPSVVVLDAVVSKTGDVGQIRAISGDDVLAEAAASAVKRWRYRPGTYNGTPADFRLQITITFRSSEHGPES